MNDRSLQPSVREELEWNLRVNSARIGVIVKDGIVTLTGWAATGVVEVKDRLTLA